MEDRYVMLVDENGEPYLAHAGFLQRARTAAGNAVNSVRSAVAGRGGTRQNHKYLMKIGSPDNPRYLYTQEEVRAYLRGGRNALNNMANKAGQTAKNAVNTVKKTTGKAVDAVKDKAGVDERQRAEEAWSKVPKQLSSKDEKGMQAFREANKAQDEYRKTPLGRAEYLTERAQEIATGADGTAKDIVNKAASSLKSAGERMREEFRKRNEERKAKKEEEASETEPKSEEQNWKDNRPAGRTRNVTGKADPIEAKKKAKYGEYNENDPDFSDANYEKAKSIGDSDFSHFKRPDGTSVILEEDMKWVLPKGVDANNPKIRKAIQQFANQVESARSLGKENYTSDEWLEGVNKAIDEAVEEIQKDNKRSSGR